jgi:LTXXQ motif family protein
MATIGVRIAVFGLALAILGPSQQACAFGLRLGPFLFGWRAHHHRHLARRPTEAPHPDSVDGAQNRTASLLYPILMWPSFSEDIFRPTSISPWPFTYQRIFSQAFAEYSAKRSVELCGRPIGKGDAVLHIGREIAPTAAQQPLLQKLGAALALANGYLIKSCPAEVPPSPAERLQLMESQIDVMTMALEIVRVPLQEFERSLDDKQRARISAPMTNKDITPACAERSEPANWPMPVLKQALQATADQEAAMDELERAFNRASSGLNTICPDGTPRMPSARLQAIEARLDTTWVAVQTIQVAIAEFQKQLNDQQRAQLNAVQLAPTQSRGARSF